MNNINILQLTIFTLLIAGCTMNLNSEEELLDPNSRNNPFLGGSNTPSSSTVDIAVHYLLPVTIQNRTEIRSYFNGVTNISQIVVCSTNNDIEIWTIDYVDAVAFEAIFTAAFTGTYYHIQTPKTAYDPDVEVELEFAEFDQTLNEPIEFKVKFTYDQSCP